MEELKVFEREEFGKIRMMIIDGKEMFVAKDIAKALGYAESSLSSTISKKCKNAVKSTIEADCQNGKVVKTQTSFISEGDIYRLVASSPLPSAEKFESWIFDDVLPTIRKTGGYVNNDDLFINTYLPFADDTTKMLFKGTLETVRKQNELIEKQKETITVQSNEITHKEDIIIGLTKDIDLAEKRQRITQIIRHNSKKYQERYNLLYEEFNKKFHVDIQRRLDNGKERGEIKKSVNKMEYICSEKYMNMTNELYDLACKLFEGDFIQLLDEWKETVSK